MAKKPDVSQDRGEDRAARHKVIEAALGLAAAEPWHRIALADIAAGAGLTMGDLYRLYPSRAAIFLALLRDIDRRALAQATEREGSARDRLFDALMRRFDALAPLKPGIKATVAALCRGKPGVLPSAAMAALHVSFALGWYLEAAGITVEGLAGLARVKLATLAYGAAFRAWLDDDSEDLARTMAALDKALGRVWPLLGLGRANPVPASAEDKGLDAADAAGAA